MDPVNTAQPLALDVRSVIPFLPSPSGSTILLFPIGLNTMSSGAHDPNALVQYSLVCGSNTGSLPLVHNFIGSTSMTVLGINDIFDHSGN